MEQQTERVVTEITSGIEPEVDPGRAEHEAAYLKSARHHLGTRVPVVRRIVRATMRESGITDRTDVLALAEALWARRYEGRAVHELRFGAVEALSYRRDVLGVDDLPLVERFVREAGTWALVDGLAAGVAGTIAAGEPAAGPVLDRWAREEDVWVRRSALLALLVPLREGGGDWERFGAYADSMLDEQEFFVRKAIGWVLRETARERPELVADWIRARPGRIPVLAVREAARRLPEDVGEELVAQARRRH